VTTPYRTGDAPEPVLAAFNGKVFAFEPTSGRRRWTYDSETSAVVRLALDGGRVYVLVRASLACLDLTSGVVIWSTRCIDGDTILVAGGLILVGGAGEVACLSRDGNRVWTDELKGHGIGDVTLAYKGVVASADRSG
jgi:outer membrane protein assembly factor BamB